MVDQCVLGAVLPDQHDTPTPIKKPTAIAVIDEKPANMLQIMCSGNHGHLPIEGSSHGIGNRASAAGLYQAPMCDYLSNIIHSFLMEEAHALDDGEEIEEVKRGIIQRLLPKTNQELSLDFIEILVILLVNSC